MNPTEPALDRRTSLVYLVVLVGVIATGPVVAGASGGGDLEAEPALARPIANENVSGVTANEDVLTATAYEDVSDNDATRIVVGDATYSVASDEPFIPAYGGPETDTHTTFEMRDVGRDGGPILEASSNPVEAPEQRDPEPVSDATLDGTSLKTPVAPSAVDTAAGNDAGGAPTDSRAADAGDRRSVISPEGVLGVVTAVPVEPPAPLQVSEFGLGFVFGGAVVALVSLRNRNFVSSLPGFRESEGSAAADGNATGDATTTRPENETGERPADDLPPAGPEVPEAESDFVPDDRLVERILARHQGRLKQTAIVEATDWSKSKVSRLLASMAEEGRIVKVSVGRENVIYLKGEEPQILSEPSPAPG